MKNFQTILMVIFGAGAIIGIFIFSGFIKIGEDPENELKGSVVIWGEIEESSFNNAINSVIGNLSKNLTITYVKKNKDTYQSELLNAFARGIGPDLFMVTPSTMLANNDFVYKIPYESFSELSYRNKYIDGADIFLDGQGIKALPLVVDPLVLYYNKNILANEGIAIPPYYWDDLFKINSLITKKQDDGNIKESMIALGEYDNVFNAKAILSNLLLQSGNKIVSRDEDGRLYSTISEESAVPALRFFMEFSNKDLPAFSWSKSLPGSRYMFTSDRLALYVGFASEIFEIEKINPNLSFDVKEIMQTRDSKNKKAFGNIYALGISKSSRNLPAAFAVAFALTSDTSISELSKSLSLPPSTRSLLSIPQKEPYLEIFFKSAIISNAWLEPGEMNTDSIFKELIDNVSSKKFEIKGALERANTQINRYYK